MEYRSGNVEALLLWVACDWVVCWFCIGCCSVIRVVHMSLHGLLNAVDVGGLIRVG